MARDDSRYVILRGSRAMNLIKVLKWNDNKGTVSSQRGSLRGNGNMIGRISRSFPPHIDAPEPQMRLFPKGIHYAQAEKRRAILFHNKGKINHSIFSETSTLISSVHRPTYVAPVLRFPAAPFIIDLIVLLNPGVELFKVVLQVHWRSGCRRRTWAFWRDYCIVRRPSSTRSSPLIGRLCSSVWPPADSHWVH